jgi:hypothetical protein
MTKLDSTTEEVVKTFATVTGRLLGNFVFTVIQVFTIALLLALCVYWIVPAVALAWWQWPVIVLTFRLLVK